MPRPTIKDVSRLAGVSIGTVSNVVNGHESISPHTRAKVERAIEQLGYRANRAAKSLPAGHTGLLGYRMPGEGSLNSSMDQFLHQIAQSAGEAGLELLLFTPRPGQSELDAYRDVIYRGGVDAFVLAGIEYQDSRVEYLNKAKVPFAAFGRAEQGQDAVWVDVDGAQGLRLSVRHLHELGRKCIGFLGWPEGSLTGDERYRGYAEEMHALGLEIPPKGILRIPDGFERGQSVARSFLEAECDAVVCVSDTFALGVMAGLRRLDKVPGDELAVIGFDDVAAAALVEPGLSSIRQPMETVGKQLVEMLSMLIRSGDSASGRLLEPTLVARGSTLGSPKKSR